MFSDLYEDNDTANTGNLLETIVLAPYQVMGDLRIPDTEI